MDGCFTVVFSKVLLMKQDLDAWMFKPTIWCLVPNFEVRKLDANRWFVCYMLTPGRLSAGIWDENHLFEKENHPTNLCDFGFKMLIFQGVKWFVFADLFCCYGCFMLVQSWIILVKRWCVWNRHFLCWWIGVVVSFSKVLVTLTYLYLPQVYVFYARYVKGTSNRSPTLCQGGWTSRPDMFVKVGSNTVSNSQILTESHRLWGQDTLHPPRLT